MLNLVYTLLEKIGDFVLFICQILLHFKKIDLLQTFWQVLYVGYFSLPIVALSAFFTGAVLAVQSYMGFGKMQSEMMIAKIVTVSLTREVGPALAGVVVSGRIASAIAAELGSMRVTEQIDALKSLSVNCYGYLVLPRVLAGILFFPFIAIVADVLGILGSYVVCVYKFSFNGILYIQNTLAFLGTKDVYASVIKCLAFGIIATSVSCYNGMHCAGGAKGVGDAVTQSVVSSFVLIILFNYLITLLMFS